LLALGIVAGAQPALHFGGRILIKFRAMTSSYLFNRGTTFLQTVTDKILFARFPKIRTFHFINQDEGRTIRTE